MTQPGQANVEPIPKIITKKATMKLSALVDQGFSGGIFAFGALDFKAAQGYWIAKVVAKYISVTKQYDETRLACLKKYAEKNEQGETVFDDKGQAKFATPEARAAFEAELKELQAQEVEILKVSTDVITKNPDLVVKPNILAAIDEIFY